MTKDQENQILNMAANWAPEFLLKKIDEIIVKAPIKDMLKRQIPSYLLAEMDSYSDELKYDIVLHVALADLTKIKYAKDTINKNKSLLMASSPNIYYEIIDEIKEIEEDFRWERTKKGQLILEIEEWIDMARHSLPENVNKTIIIGRNITDDDPCNIIVGGYSQNMTYSEIEGIVMSLVPPVRPLFIFPRNYNTTQDLDNRRCD